VLECWPSEWNNDLHVVEFQLSPWQFSSSHAAAKSRTVMTSWYRPVICGPIVKTSQEFLHIFLSLGQVCPKLFLRLEIRNSQETRSSADVDKPTWRHVIYIIGLDDAQLNYCVFSISKKAAVRHLAFSYFFTIFVKNNSNLHLCLRRHGKFGEDWMMHGQVIAYFRFSKWRPSAILDLVWHHSRPLASCVWWS